LRGGTGGLDSGRHNTSSPHAEYWLNGGARHRCAYEILFRLNHYLFSADFAEWWAVVLGMPEKWFRDEWWLCQGAVWGRGVMGLGCGFLVIRVGNICFVRIGLFLRNAAIVAILT
jgi:hypothetical protein